MVRFDYSGFPLFRSDKIPWFLGVRQWMDEFSLVLLVWKSVKLPDTSFSVLPNFTASLVAQIIVRCDKLRFTCSVFVKMLFIVSN